MKVVLDTNCFISCICKKSLYRNVFDSFLNEDFILCFSTEILYEYEEIFLEKWGMEVTQNLLARTLRAKNIFIVETFFDFNLSFDTDDNKFINSCIDSNADYLVSNDTHILALKNNPFPPLHILTLQEFSLQLNALSQS